MTNPGVTFWLTLFSTACWPVSFWLMWRIPVRQNMLIRRLREQTQNLHELTREEHQLLKQTQPKISEIDEKVQAIARGAMPPAAKPANQPNPQSST